MGWWWNSALHIAAPKRYGGVGEDAYRKKLIDYRKGEAAQRQGNQEGGRGNLIFLRTLFEVPAIYGQKIQENLQAA